MNKVYEFDLSSSGMKKIREKLLKIKELSFDDDFVEYLGKCAYQTLEEQTNKYLNADLEDNYFHSYRNGHTMTINKLDKTITLSNKTMVDLDSLNLSDETRAKYPNGLSLAKIVEFGTGIVGAQSEGSSHAEDWQYDVNGHGSKGWVYMGTDGVLHFTKGTAGRLIFYKTKNEIKKNIKKWTTDYLDRKLEE